MGKKWNKLASTFYNFDESKNKKHCVYLQCQKNRTTTTTVTIIMLVFGAVYKFIKCLHWYNAPCQFWRFWLFRAFWCNSNKCFKIDLLLIVRIFSFVLRIFENSFEIWNIYFIFWSMMLERSLRIFFNYQCFYCCFELAIFFKGSY